MEAFKRQYLNRDLDIPEINISLGPAGELRYPAYNSHDGWSYPHGGFLQSYSDLAKHEFRNYLRQKYINDSQLKSAWNNDEVSFNTADFPSRSSDLYKENRPKQDNYTLDIYTWYHKSLLDHGNRLMNLAVEIFKKGNQSFTKAELGAKIPGLHWKMGFKYDDEIQLHERSMELNSGIITPNQSTWLKNADYGYHSILSMFKNVMVVKDAPITVHFTCLEMNDGYNTDPKNDEAKSLAKVLVKWFGETAHRLGIPLKGENALGPLMGYEHSWNNVREALDHYSYDGLTVLRMDGLYQSPTGRAQLESLIEDNSPQN